MANALLDPSLWVDNYFATPPSAWNGSAYEVIASEAYVGDFISSVNPVTGTVGFTMEVVTPDVSDPSPVLNVLVAGSVVWSQALDATGSFVFASDTLMDATVLLQFSGGGVGPIYAGDYKITPTPDQASVVAPCMELGRVTRIYASGYDRARVHGGQLVRGEARCLLVILNGAIAAGRAVTSVTWRCSDPSVIVMSNARIQADLRSVAVDVRANLPCDTAIKCEATLDNGERYMQLIRLAVMDSPWFGDETTASGPMVLTSP